MDGDDILDQEGEVENENENENENEDEDEDEVRVLRCLKVRTRRMCWVRYMVWHYI